MTALSTIPGPDVLVATLGFLMARYEELPSRETAETVVQVMEVLLAHPDFETSVDERSAFKCILKRWRAKSLFAIDHGTPLLENYH